MKERNITHCYRDPLSHIWLGAAKKIGLNVVRTEHAFAHTDGTGTLHIASEKHLDPDDCLAQMIFHELCHSLVAGPDGFSLADWGLDNTCTDDHHKEHATLRVQALLAGRYGLRHVLAPTTDFRAYYDNLGPDPIADRSDESCHLALPAIRLAKTNPWSPHLERALEATATIVSIAARWLAPSPMPVVYGRINAPVPKHPTGLFGRNETLAETCGDCAWHTDSGRCRQVDQVVATDIPACERFERAFDCQDCGACCRSAYHSVTLAQGDKVATRHPDLVVYRETYSEIRRQDDHCAALDTLSDGRFACTIYPDRPTCCQEFENAGLHCLTARRRLGFSL